MSSCQYGSPLGSGAALVAALVEQGLSEAEARATAASLRTLQVWVAPEPETAVAERLKARLFAGAARQIAHQAAPKGVLDGLTILLQIAMLQVRILRPAFWLSSFTMVVLGGLVVELRPDAPRVLLLYLLGPLIGYLAVATAFHGACLGLLECELACPPSPRQLVVARLTVILAYCATLGVGMALALNSEAAAQLTLAWLAPLLIEVGMTLLLSVRIQTQRAAAVVYAGWATVLGVVWAAGWLASGPGMVLDSVLVAAGAAAVGVSVYAAPRTLERQLRDRQAAA
jgi:hypothetical protein